MNPSNMLGEDEAIVESDWLFLVKPTEYFTEFFQLRPITPILVKYSYLFLGFASTYLLA